MSHHAPARAPIMRWVFSRLILVWAASKIVFCQKCKGKKPLASHQQLLRCRKVFRYRFFGGLLFSLASIVIVAAAVWHTNMYYMMS